MNDLTPLQKKIKESVRKWSIYRVKLYRAVRHPIADRSCLVPG
jgi:hypothetical protein